MNTLLVTLSVTFALFLSAALLLIHGRNWMKERGHECAKVRAVSQA